MWRLAFYACGLPLADWLCSKPVLLLPLVIFCRCLLALLLALLLSFCILRLASLHPPPHDSSLRPGLRECAAVWVAQASIDDDEYFALMMRQAWGVTD